MSTIKKAKEIVKTAFEKLKRFQSGEDKPFVTSDEKLNDALLGGLFPKSVLVIAAISGGGKTTKLQQLEEDFFNPVLNPNADKHVLLRCNWEMSVFKLTLRKLKMVLKRKLTDILYNPVAEEDKDTYNNIFLQEASDRVFYMEEPTDPDTWFKDCDEFLQKHKKAKMVLITVDHIALVKDTFGGKKRSMDTLIEFMNILTNRYDNVAFIALSQLNREIENRKDVHTLAPQRSDLYNTDTLFHIADVVLVLHNPHKLGHSRYMLVPSKQYVKHLKKYMLKPENDRTNFATADEKGNPYFFAHLLKTRDIDSMNLADHVDLYITETGGEGTQSNTPPPPQETQEPSLTKSYSKGIKDIKSLDENLNIYN